jgi:hypothetical protein
MGAGQLQELGACGKGYGFGSHDLSHGKPGVTLLEAAGGM